MSVTKEGYGIILKAGIFAILCIVVAVLFPHSLSIGIGILAVLLFLGIVYFFRDPELIIPDDPNVIVAPADGRILAIKQVSEEDFLKKNAFEISIFLSIFNVHINRIPLSGKVDLYRYQPGNYHAAFSDNAPENEQTIIGISNGKVKIVVRQIAGLIARRIVCRLKPGMQVVRGDRFGLIKFGSRTDLVLPAEVNILVHPKQRVYGGKTIIGTFANEE